jgi:hypothetical protein
MRGLPRWTKAHFWNLLLVLSVGVILFGPNPPVAHHPHLQKVSTKDAQQRLRQQFQPSSSHTSKASDSKPLPAVTSTIRLKTTETTTTAIRQFRTHPLTNAESASLSTHRDAGRPRIALCHPVIHKGTGQVWGSLLEPYFSFVSYARLLGVAQLFVWYQPAVAEHAARWDELAALDYVTLIPMPAPSTGQTRYFGQPEAEASCLTHYAKDYDWALVQDADEYFWWSQRENLLDFVEAYANYSYISLGKHMYTMLHTYESADDNDMAASFGLETYPFTAGSYCYQGQGNPYCPTWVGRCKLLVRPSQHAQAQTHGYANYHRQPDGIHLTTDVAHFKEWILLHEPVRRANPTLHATLDSFFITNDAQVVTHFTMQSHALTPRGEVEISGDQQLSDWLSFVTQALPDAQMTDAASEGE